MTKEPRVFVVDGRPIIGYPYTPERPILQGNSPDVVAFLRVGYWWLKTTTPAMKRSANRHQEYILGLCELIVFFDRYKGNLESRFAMSNGSFFTGWFGAGADSVQLGRIHAGRAILAYYKDLVATGQVIPPPKPGEPQTAYKAQIEAAKKYMMEARRKGRKSAYFQAERNRLLIEVIAAVPKQRNYTAQLIEWMQQAGWEQADIPTDMALRKIFKNT